MTSFVNTALPTEVAVPIEEEPLRLKIDSTAFGVEHIREMSQLMRLKNEWHDLERQFLTPLLTHNWIASSAYAFNHLETPDVVVVRSLGRLKAVAPLSLRGNHRRRVEILGNNFTDEPSGILFSDEEGLSALFSSMIDMGLPIYLKGLRFASPETRALEKILSENKIVSLAKEESLPWVATHGLWEDFERRISSSRRSSLRRLQRLLDSEGKVEYEVIAPSLTNVDGCLSELYNVEASSWKSRTGTALKSYQELGDFFRMYAREEAEHSRLRLMFLRVNGRAVAGQLAVVYANRLWIFKIGHDEEWSSYSPGVLLMHRAMKYCFESGLVGCELLGHDEPWLHIWPTESHSIVSYRIYPRAVDAVLDLGSDFVHICFYRLGKLLAKRWRPSR